MYDIIILSNSKGTIFIKKTVYWAVTAKCGHIGGLSKYIPITFYVEIFSFIKRNLYVKWNKYDTLILSGSQSGNSN